ncbi:MAG: hypothetical protein DHS20C18_37330 [Saprospiraceae bacterium]|nr:MAG: hypothetical protein DHS20C18_37330 [Saprospiraceae bacterium]
MKNILLTLLGLALACVATAQPNNTIYKPSTLVKASKQAGSEFQKMSLFKLSTEKQLKEAPISDYSLLDLDQEALQHIAYRAPAQLTLSFPRLEKSDLEVELVSINLFGDGFSVKESSTIKPVNIDRGVHYRGIVKGDPNSIVAISVFENELYGLISSDLLGNLVLGRVQGTNKKEHDKYILYRDQEIMQQVPFACDTPDDGPVYTADQLRETVSSRSLDDCVGIYLEVDHDIYQNKGGTDGAANYITALFNEVATLYANENVNVVISEIMVWNTPSPYTGSSSGALLTQFQNYRGSFNGNLAQLVSYQASGGIAVLSGLCHPYVPARMSFASIGTGFNTVPTYSWSVMVMAHELGHLLGSQHTHACVWNGNGTAIDGCAGVTEGSCSNPGYPASGGTIMSYCHLTSVGINFNQGFGTQPGNIIRNRVSSANCLQACANPPGGGGGNGGGDDDDPVTSCENNEVYLTVVLDNFGPETSWELQSATGTVMHEGGPYLKKKGGEAKRDTFCLPDGCYSLTLFDEDGDGICCDYGEGSYQLVDKEGNVLAEGDSFEEEEETSFCLPYTDNPVGDCLEVDFNDFDIQSYGTNQDGGSYQMLGDGKVLMIQNNAWKSIALDYQIVNTTVIEFEFKSTMEGEIHGLGFDDNNAISFGRTFKVHGSQNWGLTNYDTYEGNGQWQTFAIRIGQFYQGAFDRLFFVADHDSGAHNGNSYYRNIRIYEGDGCDDLQGGATSELLENGADKLILFPNPVENKLNVQFTGQQASTANIRIMNLVGQEMKQLAPTTSGYKQTEQIDISTLAPGTYLLQLDDGQQVRNHKFTVTRS